MSKSNEQKRWQGLRALVQDAVEQGSLAIEKVQKETAARPFQLLESVPALARPTEVVHAVHDVAVTTTHASIRLVNRVVGRVLERVIDAAVPGEPAPAEPSPADAAPAEPPAP
jgi:hypothetical protein